MRGRGPALLSSIGLSFTRSVPVIYQNQCSIITKSAAADVVSATEKEHYEPSLQLNLLFSFGGRGDTLLVKPDPLNAVRALNQRDFGQSLLLPGSRLWPPACAR